jgi:hypothetical protein
VYLDAEGNASITPAGVDNGSFDPDGDPITLSVSPKSFDCSNVDSDNSVKLTVTDDSGASNSCTTTVTVEDNSCPVITATLFPVKVKKRKGCFRVEISASDNCDENPKIEAATINYGTNGSAPVVDGQLVELKHKKKYKHKVKTDDGDSDSSSDDSSSDDCGPDRFEGPVFTLDVLASDNAGNFCEESYTFIFDDDSCSDDDSGSGHKKKKGHCSDDDSGSGHKKKKE